MASNLPPGVSPNDPHFYPPGEDESPDSVAIAASDLTLALERLYRLLDGDEAKVVQVALEAHKRVRRP